MRPHYYGTDLDNGPKSTTLYQKNLVSSMLLTRFPIMILNTPPVVRSTTETLSLRGVGELH